MHLDIIIPVVLLGAGVVLGWVLNVKNGQNRIASAKEAARKVLLDAEKEAETLKREKLLEVKDEWYSKKKEFDSDVQSKKNKLQAQEKALEVREENIDRKVELLGKKEREQLNLKRSLEERARTLDGRQTELDRLVAEENIRLERTSGLSREEAKKQLIDNLANEARQEAALLLKEIRDKARDDAKKEAQKLIVQAIQRTAADHSVETTVSVLNIQSDEMKGRIIGREGRNIRAFEAATGVDVIVDDTPEAVILSAFDPFRREVARVSLERLIADGRIHPARIEEVVEKVRCELEEEVIRVGENTLLEMGLHGAHKELLRLLGRMKYRSSYGQNMLQHSIEVAYLTGMMAAELGLDANLAKRSGLFHDIGKCVDRSVEGPHALLGMEIAKKYGEHALVANAIGSHHDDVPMESPIAPLVQAADAISGARPGARRESVEGYVKRLEKLEAFAQSFQGVAKTYAIQAGREVRVVVEQDRVDDAMADQLAHDISAKIQREMEYPGQIKVTVIREFRSVAYAK
ncbi:MAG: 2',3'-cyclic-nucleotide 2'-phosphodiesterase [Bacteroidetes bacterium]|jgi:ribonuclease Y|nr:2',3'-cyclic-nucleotide 2'-phosphodiesterase [Bacteroidota bacterium]